MLQTQKQYSEYLRLLKGELEGVKYNCEKIDSLREMVENIQLVVPIVGAFSSGKSTLINAFLGSDTILPVAITPETSLATELHYSENERIEGVRENGSIDTFKISDIIGVKDRAKEYEYAKIYLNNQNLKAIEPLVLVDMPGYDSPLDIHNKAIAKYLSKGCHFINLTSVEEGTITRTMLRRLREISSFNREISFFLSKSNIRSSSEVEEIRTAMKEQIEFEFEEANVVAIGKNGAENLEKVLKELDLEKMIEKLFKGEIEELFFGIKSYLNTEISALTKSEKENSEMTGELHSTLLKITEKRNKLQEEVKTKYSDVNMGKIVDGVGRDLNNSIDELCKAAKTSQEKFEVTVNEIVKSSIIQGVNATLVDIKMDVVRNFSLELKNIGSKLSAYTGETDWANKIITGIEKFSMLGSILNAEKKESKKLSSGYKLGVSLLAITTSFAAPIVELALLFLPEIIGLFTNQVNKSKEEQELKEKIMAEIAGIKRDVRAKLTVIFNEEVIKMVEAVGAEFEQKVAEKEVEIKEAEEKKKAISTDIKEEIAAFKTTLESVQKLSSQMLF